MKRINIFIATILILAAVGLAVWYFFGERIGNYWHNRHQSTSQSKTVDSSTAKPDSYQAYTNQTYGYTVYFPPSWTASADNAANPASITYLADKNNSAGVKAQITVTDNSDRLLLEHFIQRYNTANGINPATEESVEISGITSVKQTTMDPTPLTLIYFREGNLIFSIVFSGPASDYEKNIGAFSKIYHSFVFD